MRAAVRLDANGFAKLGDVGFHISSIAVEVRKGGVKLRIVWFEAQRLTHFRYRTVLLAAGLVEVRRKNMGRGEVGFDFKKALDCGFRRFIWLEHKAQRKRSITLSGGKWIDSAAFRVHRGCAL